ncbi:MAG: Abi family protein [Candidatus Cyclobacteriaceae bacterium M2_1C_046]
MRYSEFEKVMSSSRMNRYLQACSSDSRKAMTLYRRNLQLSQELFTIISCFEIALRNAVNDHYLQQLGSDWLRNAARRNGIFDHHKTRLTKNAINDALRALNNNSQYTHPKLVAELGFGFWRYLFGTHQYRAGGQTLIRIFINKLQSTPQMQYNANYIFTQLAEINELRNRIAHHEPICFRLGAPIIDTSYAIDRYEIILRLFQWLGIDEKDLLYGIDHVDTVADEINSLI